jgi:hypothetical protein
MTVSTRLATDQQAKVVEDFQSEDSDLQQDAIAVFCEHDMTIRDVAAMVTRVNNPGTLDDALGQGRN